MVVVGTFKWEKVKVIYVNVEHNNDGSKIYKINESFRY